MLEKETLKKTLLNLIDLIDTDSSNYTNEEYNEILDSINRITNTHNRLSKYQACQYLGISRATFDNYVRDGKLPRGEKALGFKELSWDLGTIKKFKNANTNNTNIRTDSK